MHFSWLVWASLMFAVGCIIEAARTETWWRTWYAIVAATVLYFSINTVVKDAVEHDEVEHVAH